MKLSVTTLLAIGLILTGGLVGCDRGQIGLAELISQSPNLDADPTDADQPDAPPDSNEISTIDRANDSDEIRVLFIGNSHSAPIPRLLTKLFRKQQPQTKTRIQTARSFGFLADHASVPATLELINSGDWDFVVLQAQRYSTSGKYTYPTDGAIKLSKAANEAGAKIIMYPEWSRAGAPEEYKRIKAIHVAISEETGAQVAPIGEAWAEAGRLLDQKRLYAADGNHASEKGSFLNACVFYSMITNRHPGAKPGSSAQTRTLEQAAWSAYQASLKAQSSAQENQ